MVFAHREMSVMLEPLLGKQMGSRPSAFPDKGRLSQVFHRLSVHHGQILPNLFGCCTCKYTLHGRTDALPSHYVVQIASTFCDAHQ